MGLGCGGDGGVGPTMVAYLHKAGAGTARTIEITTFEAATGMAEALWLATVAAVGTAVVAVGVGAAATKTTRVGSRLGLDLPARGEEEWRTRGLKLCPPRVFTMPRPEKERRI